MPGPVTRSIVCPKNNRTTRHLRSASKNVQYIEELDENIAIVKNKTGYVQNIKPSASESGLNPNALNNLLQVYQDYQSLRLTRMMVKKNQIQMYQWKHHLKLSQTKLIQDQRKALSVLRVIHSKRNQHHGNTSVKCAMRYETVFII